MKKTFTCVLNKEYDGLQKMCNTYPYFKMNFKGKIKVTVQMWGQEKR